MYRNAASPPRNRVSSVCMAAGLSGYPLQPGKDAAHQPPNGATRSRPRTTWENQPARTARKGRQTKDTRQNGQTAEKRTRFIRTPSLQNGRNNQPLRFNGLVREGASCSEIVTANFINKQPEKAVCFGWGWPPSECDGEENQPQKIDSPILQNTPTKKHHDHVLVSSP